MNSINTKVSLNQLVVKTLYYRYKVFIVPVSTLAVCALLFLFIIIPQIQSWFAMRDAITGDEQKLSVLKQNLQIISRLDDTKLDTYLGIVSSALPPEKDFAGVLQAISSATANAGTSLGDYNFQIGDLVGSDAQNKSGQLPLQLSINLKGDLVIGKHFIEELKKQLPLSDVTSISVNSNGTITLAIVFYYAPLPKIVFDDSIPLTTLSPKDEEVLKLLNLNQNTQSIPQLTVSASPSARTQ